MELTDSWVEVHPKPLGASFDSSNDPSLMEALLKEAQKEGSSRSLSGNNTPPSVPGSNNSMTEFKQCTDWIWDWSSRPEVNNSRSMSAFSRMCSPKPSEYPYSFRKSEFWKEANSVIDVYYERLSLMMVTHACTFLLGATAVMYFVRKWKARTSTSTLLFA